MYRLKKEDFLQKRFLALWGLLAFQAGFINSFGFLSCQRFVSHVTGFGTQLGVSLGAGNLWRALEMLGTPVSFILGSFLSGALTVARVDRGQRPRYDLVCSTIPAVLIACAIAGNLGLLGTLCPTLHPHDFALLFVLSFACGMPNGCFATMTQGQIRTTHLTGISTDLGTDFARTLFGRLPPAERATVRVTNISRLVTFSSFAVGAVVSALVYSNWNFHALWLPSATSLTSLLLIRKISRKLELEKLKGDRARRAESVSFGFH